MLQVRAVSALIFEYKRLKPTSTGSLAGTRPVFGYGWFRPCSISVAYGVPSETLYPPARRICLRQTTTRQERRSCYIKQN
jgi:hypothetical protein